LTLAALVGLEGAETENGSENLPCRSFFFRYTRHKDYRFRNEGHGKEFRSSSTTSLLPQFAVDIFDMCTHVPHIFSEK
jgi:hypothetical protein